MLFEGRIEYQGKLLLCYRGIGVVHKIEVWDGQYPISITRNSSLTTICRMFMVSFVSNGQIYH